MSTPESPRRKAAPPTSVAGFELRELRQLIQLVQKTGIGELELTSEGRSVRIAANAPAPDADPFIENGDAVEVGQTVCIVEAMKLMNEIESEFKGRIVEVLVENAQPIEFGQKLFLVETA